MNKKIKNDLIAVSSSGKNEAAKGVMGKIRDVVENMLYPEDSYYNSSYVAYHLETAALREDGWSLNKYKKSQKANSEPWDELEKSIIANLLSGRVDASNASDIEKEVLDIKKPIRACMW